MLSRKLYRVREAFHLIVRCAADFRSRRALVAMYGALGDLGRYDDVYRLRLRVGGSVVGVELRVQDLFVLGELLYQEQYRLASQVPDRPVIVDAGANVGISALWLLGRFPGATLHAFEPESANFTLLSRNVAALPGAVVRRAALGSSEGEIELGVSRFGAVNSVKEGFTETVRTERVPLMDLADYMQSAGLGRIDVLKLDVEGAEMDVLAGLGPRLADVGVIIGEMHESVVDPDEFYGFLESHGFRTVWRRRFPEGEAERVHGFEVSRLAA